MNGLHGIPLALIEMIKPIRHYHTLFHCCGVS
jgi:hypothetical protein